MRTSALATTAPLESCTVPVMAPVAPPWAKVMPTSEIAHSAQQRNLLTDLDIHPSPEKPRVTFRYPLGTMNRQDLKRRDEPDLPDCKNNCVFETSSAPHERVLILRLQARPQAN